MNSHYFGLLKEIYIWLTLIKIDNRCLEMWQCWRYLPPLYKRQFIQGTLWLFSKQQQIEIKTKQILFFSFINYIVTYPIYLNMYVVHVLHYWVFLGLKDCFVYFSQSFSSFSTFSRSHFTGRCVVTVFTGKIKIQENALRSYSFNRLRQYNNWRIWLSLKNSLDISTPCLELMTIQNLVKERWPKRA